MKSQSIFAMFFIAIVTASASAEVLRVPLTPEQCVAAGCAEVVEVPQPATATALPVDTAPVAKEVVAEVPAEKVPRVMRWRNRGANPCRPPACTLEKALVKAREESGWPAEITDAFMDAVKNGTPQRDEICHGWQGWMTWGKDHFKFHPNTLAVWGEGVCEPVNLWEHRRGELVYKLILPDVCSNWGGWTEPVPSPEISAPELVVESKNEPPLGVIPITYCP